MGTSELIEGAIWLGREFLKIFYSPTGVAGGMLDAFRGWKFSRSWVRFWFHLPSLVLLTSVYLTFAFSIFGREDSRIQLFSVESQKRCPTKLIEDICNQMHEEDFATVLGLPDSEKIDYKIVAISDLTKRYVELLSKRILSIQSRNLVAQYRLGMIYNINGKAEEGFSKLKELAKGTFGDCPQANAWMVKELLRQKVAGADISNQELLSNLEKLSKSRDVDFRLVSFYARVLEESGETLKAIAVSKQAASVRPELNLELARLYSRVGYQNEMRSAASVVEDFFIKKLNSPLEKETDRLAVAEARKMTNRLDQAAQILTEGLLNKSTGPAIRRELSEVLRLIYLNSIFKTEAGPFQADITQLEKAGEVDPLNPNISSEIAKLLPLKIKPSKKLMEILKQQIEAGITSVSAHVLLAEGYFAVGNMKEAMKNWELALAKDPNNIGAMNNLALVLARTSDANVDRSLSLLNKALSLSPGNAEILDSLGDVLMIANRPRDAINKYELSIRNDATRNETRKKLLGAYERNGMEDMAKVLRKVIVEKEKPQADGQANSNE
jgi:tetratricopeptide (TPR) repeat protein